jgi:hypothetical protein
VLANVYCPVSAAGGVYGYTDSNPNPTTLVRRVYNPGQPNTFEASIMFPVRKNDYWRVAPQASASVLSVYWLPWGPK